MSCVLILFKSNGTYSLRLTTNNRFFSVTFHVKFIYTQSFCQKTAKNKSSKKYIYFHTPFWDILTEVLIKTRVY